MNEDREQETLDEPIRSAPLSRIDRVEADLLRLRDTEALVRQMQQSMPTLEKTMDETAARQSTLAHELAGVAQIIEDLRRIAAAHEYRIEFIRREVMLEVRYGRTAQALVPKTVGTTSEGRVVNQEKVDDAVVSGLKLNVGCGHVQFPDYINVDARELPGVDVVADVRSIPFADGSVTEILSTHVLEHFPEEDLRRGILPHWHRLLTHGGRIRVTVPDADTMIREYAAGRYCFDDLRLVTYGGQDYGGDFHFNMFTASHLVELLEEAGFADLEIVEQARRNDVCYEMEITGAKL